MIRNDLTKEDLEKEFKNSNLVVVTGAGISTLSGIPDYSTMNGIIASDNLYYPARDVLSLNFIERFREDFFEWYNEHFHSKKFEPNQIHDWVKSLEKIAQKVTVITQNVNGLHNGIDNLIEFHGNAYKFDETGLPDIVYYGKNISKENYNNTEKALKNPHNILILGTNLEVEPLRTLILEHTNENTFWINKTIPKIYNNLHEDINLILKDFNDF